MRRGELATYLGIAALAVCLCLVVTRHRVGFDSDTSTYLGTAENILDGRGVTTPFPVYTSGYGPREAASFDGAVPLTHYPPLYPVTVAAVASAGLDVETAARWTGAACLGVDVLLLALLARRAVQSVPATAAVVVVSCVGPVQGLSVLGPTRSWIVQNGFAMSESLFIPLSLGALLLLVRHLDTGRDRLLLCAGALAGVATTTRYLGVALAITGVVVLAPRGRHRTAAGFAALALGPIVAWTLLGRLLLDAGSPRTFHVTNPDIAGVLDAFEGWLGVSALSTSLRHIALLAVVALVAAAIIRDRASLLRTLAVYVIAFTVVVALTRMFLDAGTPFDERIFSPLQGPFYVLCAASVASLVRDIDRRALAPSLTIALATVLVLNAFSDNWNAVQKGFPPAPPASSIAESAAALPPNAFVATNETYLFWESARRPAISVPLRIDTTSSDGRANTRFDEEVADLVQLVNEKHGYIVLLNGPGRLVVNITAAEDDFNRYPSLRVREQNADGVIYESA